jgi:transposase
MVHRTEEFRKNAVRMCEARDWRVAEVARELGVKYQTLYRWVWNMRGPLGTTTATRPKGSKSPAPKPDGSEETLQEEVVRLRRENRNLVEDIEIAKKAAAFFARHQR